MNISSRCEYGCRAMLGLARQYASQQTLPSVALAEEWHIPEKYLVHILLQLKRAGLVRSVRGAQGGYLLAMSPELITLLDVIQAIDGPVLDPLPIDDAQADILRPAWLDAAERISAILRETTLQQLMDTTGDTDMYYI